MKAACSRQSCSAREKSGQGEARASLESKTTTVSAGKVKDRESIPGRALETWPRTAPDRRVATRVPRPAARIRFGADRRCQPRGSPRVRQAAPRRSETKSDPAIAAGPPAARTNRSRRGRERTRAAQTPAFLSRSWREWSGRLQVAIMGGTRDTALAGFLQADAGSHQKRALASWWRPLRKSSRSSKPF